MMNFLAINTEQADGEKNVYPFNLKKFLELIRSKVNYKLPKFYAAVCSVCYKQTYYQGQNRGNKLQVIVT